MVSGYQPPAYIIDAMNEAGLWHGRASILVRQQVRRAFEEDPYDRWEHQILEAFGGLYISDSEKTAKHYAQGAAQAIEGYYWPSSSGDFTWAFPAIHRIFLVPGVEIALDEDELGWAYLPNEENNWEALGLYRDNTVKLAYEAGIGSELDEQFAKLFRELEAEEDKDPAFYWEPMDEAPLIEKLSLEIAGPIIEKWYENWVAGNVLELPDLRLLNQMWYAEPPIADRLS